MARVIEKHYDHAREPDRDASSAVSLVLLGLAILLIIGFILYAFRALPFGTAQAGTTPGTNQYDIDVQTPDLTPG